MNTAFIQGALPLVGKYTSFVFFTDDHFPHNLFFDAKLKMLSDLKPDYLILGGDMLNMDPFNHWAKNVPRQVKTMPSPRPYYELANKEFFKPLREAVGKKTKIIYILGNHEVWSHKAVDMLPEGEGYFEVENNIDKAYVNSFVKSRHLVALGNLWFSHGDNIPFSKSQHARKMVTLLHRNIMFGHYHDYEVYSLSTPVDEKPLTAYSVPCSTITNPCSYGRDLPTNRTQGFGMGYVKRDGEFSAEIVQIKDGEFRVHDKVYKSKQTIPRRLPYTL